MEQLVNLFWVLMLPGGFCLLLALGEIIMDILYDLVPSYRKWFDKHTSNWTRR